MKIILRPAMLLVLLVLSPFGPAQAARLDDEIAYLIGFVRQSSCTFIRNGSEYAGGAAADHIQAKYEHFKDEIHSVDDFIARAASKSLMSGKPYAVRCDGKTMPAADWLRAEDADYRAKHP